MTHGDADHFKGLVEIYKSETNGEPKKRLFIAPDRIFHNCLVKGPSKKNGRSVPDKELLGPTTKVGNETILTGLVDAASDVENIVQDASRQMSHACRNYRCGHAHPR